jgi:hypothetical protein
MKINSKILFIIALYFINSTQFHASDIGGIELNFEDGNHSDIQIDEEYYPALYKFLGEKDINEFNETDLDGKYNSLRKSIISIKENISKSIYTSEDTSNIIDELTKLINILRLSEDQTKDLNRLVNQLKLLHDKYLKASE